MSERRKHKRYSTNIKANYALTEKTIFGAIKRQASGECIIETMSYNGIKINMSGNPCRNACVFIEIILDNLGIALSASGKVIWARTDNGTSICGIKLNWVSDDNMYCDYIKMLEAAESLY